MDAVSFSRSFAPTDVRNGDRPFGVCRSSFRICDGNAEIGFESSGESSMALKAEQVAKEVSGQFRRTVESEG